MVEHTHNNPTLRVFCQLLVDSIQPSKAPRPVQVEEVYVQQEEEETKDTEDTQSCTISITVENSDVEKGYISCPPDGEATYRKVIYRSWSEPTPKAERLYGDVRNQLSAVPNGLADTHTTVAAMAEDEPTQMESIVNIDNHGR